VAKNLTKKLTTSAVRDLDGLERGEVEAVPNAPGDAADGPGDQGVEAPAAPPADVPRPGELDCHPVSSLFPAMTEEEYGQLKEDIREHGQHEPIRTHGGKIIDGRHRYRACRELGIEPRVEEWPGVGSLVAYVLSLNLRRRHLSASQRAMIAAGAKDLFEEEARQRQLAGKKQDLPINGEGGQSGEAAAQAAELLNVGPATVYKAQTVLKKGAPALQDAVTQGRLSVSAAAELADLPHEEQVATVGQGGKGAREKAKEVRQHRKAKKSPAREAGGKPAQGKAGARRPTRAVLDGLAVHLEGFAREARRAKRLSEGKRDAALDGLLDRIHQVLERARVRDLG
jgi:ParB-like chromosome segregation protein Spo0J